MPLARLATTKNATSQDKVVIVDIFGAKRLESERTV
jgi:hypothetical protein